MPRASSRARDACRILGGHDEWDVLHPGQRIAVAGCCAPFGISKKASRRHGHVDEIVADVLVRRISAVRPVPTPGGTRIACTSGMPRTSV